MTRGQRTATLVIGLVLAVVLTAVAGQRVVALTTGPVHHDELRSFAAPAHELAIEADAGTVEITPTRGRTVTVESHLRGGLDMPALEAHRRGDGTLELDASCAMFPLDDDYCETSMTVRVPAGLRVRAHTQSGDIEAMGLRSGVELSAGSGDISVWDIGGPVRLHSSSGDVSALRAGGPLALATSSGDVTGTNLAARRLEASTSSGDVVASFLRAPDRVDASTSSGDVSVEVPRRDRAAYDVRAETDNGSQSVGVRSDPFAPRRIDARTSTGDVVVRYTQR